MPKLRVHNLSMSLDGYGAGPDQSIDHPLGVGGNRLHTWAFKTRAGRQMLGQSGGDVGLDNDFWTQGNAGIGATIMGRNMFGPIRGPWDDEEWKGDPEVPRGRPDRRDARRDRAGASRRRRTALRPLERRRGPLRVRRVGELAGGRSRSSRAQGVRSAT
jgi:hypothetical protein